MGVRVKVVDSSKMDEFVKLLEDTAINKNFIIRPASYYKKMVDLMNNYITLYIAYIDTNLYYDYVWNTLENTKK